MDGARAFDIAELGWQKSWLVGRRFGLCLPKFSKRRDFRLSGTLQLHYLPREKKYQVGEDRYFRDLTTSRRKRLREQQTRHTHKQSQETLQKTQFSRPTSKPEEEKRREEKRRKRKNTMKLLTLNFLTCARKTCKSSPAAFPLHPQEAELEQIELDLNPLFIKNILPRLDWTAMKTVANEVRIFFEPHLC